MSIPSVEQAMANAQSALAVGNQNVGAHYHAAVITAASAKEAADTNKLATANLQEAIYQLRDAQVSYTKVSKEGGEKLEKWTEQTARATKGLKWATWALFVAMVVQIGVMLFR